MAATNSQMLELGTIAPEFSLPDPHGEQHSPGTGAGAYLVMFICNHCPFVKHVREELARLGHDYLPRNVSIVAINSNDVNTHPGDSPAKMKEEIANWGYEFPYVFDADQNVAKSYRAACTPDFFLFNADKKLVYRGQLDASRPGNDVPVTGEDLRTALDAVLDGNPVSVDQDPSVGCNIKWTPGQEPDYFN
jgi:thiol-disulfide isomerase/thioredoxin